MLDDLPHCPPEEVLAIDYPKPNNDALKLCKSTE